MEGRKILKHIIEVTLSNCTTILSGIIVGFLVPKLLSVEGYGYYKTFTLYATYVGFFNLGMIDGIVLDYGGVDYYKMDRYTFRCYFKWYIAIHLFFLILLTIVGIIIPNENYKFIVIMLGINMIAANCTGYFQQISQITQRFKEYSLRRVLQSIANIVIVVLMLFSYKVKGNVDYKFYVSGLVILNISLTLWYIYTYREISFGKSIPMKEKKNDVIHLVKIGFPLLVANLCSTLILTLDRQFVNILFDTSTYAIYSFAYSMLALVTVATSAIATVLYPTLKRTTEETMRDNFGLLISTVLIMVFAMEIVYFPMKIFIQWFLPKYIESLIIFRVIFPGIAISSAITVVMHNYYKVLGHNLDYFKKSIIVLIFSGVANAIAYYLYRTTVAISVASIITMILWYLYIESFFVSKYKYNGKKNFLYLILMILCFYGATQIDNVIISLIVYIAAFIIITLTIHKKVITQDLKKLVG